MIVEALILTGWIILAIVVATIVVTLLGWVLDTYPVVILPLAILIALIFVFVISYGIVGGQV